MYLVLRVAVALTILAVTAAVAEPDRARQWAALIAEAKAHGGAETVLDKTASYVFVAPDGMNVTFTRTLDDRTHAVCAGYMERNVMVCANWETGVLVYSQRADESSPWIASRNPPDLSAETPEQPIWAGLLSEFLDAGADALASRALGRLDRAHFVRAFDKLAKRR